MPEFEIRAVGCPYCKGALYPYDEGKEEIARNSYNCQHGFRHGENIEITYSCYSVKMCNTCLTKFPHAWEEVEIRCYGH